MSSATAEQATSRRCLMGIARMIYVVGLLAWISYVVVLYPHWTGRGYNLQPHGGFSSWQEGGGLGLQRDRAPLWSPPADSHGTQAQVRWPWQSVSQNSHVELVLSQILFEAALGTLVLGVVLRMLHWFIVGHHPDRLVCMAWSLSLGVSIAFVYLFGIVAFLIARRAFSIYLFPDTLVLAILGLGVFGGLAYGAISCHPSQFRSIAAPTPYEPLTQRPSVKGSRPSSRTLPCRVRNALLGFTGGLFVAVGITIAAGWIASFFLRAIVGVWESGTLRYTHPQELTDVTAGLGIAMTGWVGGVLLLRYHVWRGFSIGLLVGTTLLGILYASR